MIITEEKLYTDENNKVIAFSCKVNGVEHYTADVRFIRKNKYAILSDLTDTSNERHLTKRGIIDCVNMKIYKQYNAKATEFFEDYYTWIRFKLDKKFNTISKAAFDFTVNTMSKIINGPNLKIIKNLEL